MNNNVTIVMYHFVRDLSNSRYPNIKGLDLKLFIEQIDYLQKHYNVISMEMLINAIHYNERLPKKSVVLTFDDAYIDHFLNVFPILFDKKIQGSFYTPAKAILESNVLDVNKIHFILASSSDIDWLVNRIFQELDDYRNTFKLASNDSYFNKLAVANRLDSKEVIFVKRLLQKELPEDLRNIIVDLLFKECVGMSETAFSKELYMNTSQLKCMLDSGMHIGNHGYDHYWLNSLTEAEQKKEIKEGCKFLENLGVDMNNWTMCYPYGAYNQSLMNILKESNCKLALTTKVDLVNLDRDNKFELPRLDTNDLPKNRLSQTDIWFDKI